MSRKERDYVDIMATSSAVTGSCLLMSVCSANGYSPNFIVDCGLFQEKETMEYNETFPFEAQNIDFALITHAHIDHIGRLPLLAKKGFHKEIYATEDTCKIIPHALGDSHKVLMDTARRKNQRGLYDENDVKNVIKILKPCAFSRSFKPFDNVRVTMFQNGHLIGASVIFVQIRGVESGDYINLLFTGDYKNANQFFKVASLPNWVTSLPITVIMEATYGDVDTTQITSTFRDNIEQQNKEGGTIIIPAFSLGRAQKMLYEIRCMQESGRIKMDTPIYLDGNLTIRYTQMYTDGTFAIRPDMRDFLPNNLTLANKGTRSRIIGDEKDKIIISSSGMGSYGPVHQYIQEYVTKKKALIHFTGYTAEGTLGRKLKDAKSNEAVEVDGVVLKKKARVEHTSEFSDHAKADEGIAFLKQFTNLKCVLINHGEKEVKEKFAKRVLEEIEPKNVGILSRDYIFRVNRYGLVKTMATRFL